MSVSNSIKPSPDLAYETIHHATMWLAHTQKKEEAFAVINEQENGLTEAQKGALCQKINEVQVIPRAVRAKNQLENRILAVLQPNTSKFLDDADAVAALISRLPAFLSEPPLTKTDPSLQLFTIQHSRVEMNKALVRQQIRDKTSLTTEEIEDFVGIIHGVDTRVARFNQTAEQIQEVLELAPHFYELVVTEYTPRHFFQEVAKALKNCGAKTKFRRIQERFKRSGRDQLPINSIYGNFPKFSEFHIQYSAAVPYVRSGADQLNEWLTQGFLKKLEMAAPRGFLNHLSLLENRNLTHLKLKFMLVSSDTHLNASHIATLKTLPLDALDFSESQTIDDSHLLMLAELPKLKTLVLTNCEHVTVAGIEAMLRNRNSLETISLEPYDFTDPDGNGPTLTRQQILDLADKFPKINFQNHQGRSYRPR